MQEQDVLGHGSGEVYEAPCLEPSSAFRGPQRHGTDLRGNILCMECSSVD